jgi:hypothetical protein
MGIRKEAFIGGPDCVHLVILTLNLAKGKNPQAPMGARRSWGFFALRAQNDKLVGFLKRAAFMRLSRWSKLPQGLSGCNMQDPARLGLGRCSMWGQD